MFIVSGTFEAISPDETKSYAFDFTDYLSVGDSLLTAVWSVETYEGIDPTPNAILTGMVNISTTMTAHFISNAKAGVIYRLIATCTTGLGETLELVGQLPCITGL